MGLFSRLSNDAFRDRTVRNLEKKVSGLATHQVRLIAVVTHPFDDQHRPNKAVYREVRDLSMWFTRLLRRPPDADGLAAIAGASLRKYIESAQRHDDRYYLGRWQEALDESIARQVEVQAAKRLDQLPLDRYPRVCIACGREIRWAWAPLGPDPDTPLMLDPNPVPDGTYVLRLDERGDPVIGAPASEDRENGTPLYRWHMMSCPSS